MHHQPSPQAPLPILVGSEQEDTRRKANLALLLALAGVGFPIASAFLMVDILHLARVNPVLPHQIQFVVTWMCFAAETAAISMGVRSRSRWTARFALVVSVPAALLLLIFGVAAVVLHTLT